MTKADVIAEIQNLILSEENLINRKEFSTGNISLVVDKLFTVVKRGISDGEHIELRGFGTFDRKIREPKKARIPKRNETILVERHAIAYFKPGKELKQLVKDKFKDKNE